MFKYKVGDCLLNLKSKDIRNIIEICGNEYRYDHYIKANNYWIIDYWYYKKFDNVKAVKISFKLAKILYCK